MELRSLVLCSCGAQFASKVGDEGAMRRFEERRDWHLVACHEVSDYLFVPYIGWLRKAAVTQGVV